MTEVVSNVTPVDRLARRPTHRQIVERIVITGTLVLETPAHFGNGDADAFTDMPLLADELDGSPLLPGTSIAGALRNYLRERQAGDWYPFPRPPQPRQAREHEREQRRFKDEQKRERAWASVQLFGGYRGDDEGWQSPLLVHDALGSAIAYELRDGVKIDPQTRTAEDDKKFDMQLLAAGATFPLRFELAIGRPRDGDMESYRQALLSALATALDGLARGEITLGARKRRGFGHCHVHEWTVRRYDVTTRAGLLAWLAEGRGEVDDPWTTPVEGRTHTAIVEALGGNIDLIADQRQRFTMQATFMLDGSLLVRSGFGESDQGPDMVHLHSWRPGRHGAPVRRPVFAGTSWAGVLRSRATQITNTLASTREKARGLIEGIFGPEEIKADRLGAHASRLEVTETMIAGGRLIQQGRVKIDRFTGGAAEAALFSEQPLFGGRGTSLTLELSLRTPVLMEHMQEPVRADVRRQAEIGLLLLVLKDLWTGDLPVGGEVSVGRGQLQGTEAEMHWDGQTWKLQRTADGGLQVVAGNSQELQHFVDALRKELSNA